MPTRNFKLSAAIIVALVLGIAAIAIAVDGPAPDEQEVAAPAAEATAEAVPVLEADTHRLDTAEDGKVTLVEFLDFECEACRALYPAMEQLREMYRGRVTFAIRYMPMPSHTNALLSAQVVEAASKQGKLDDMYKRMFETQKEWGESQDSKRDVFFGFAEDLGLDMEQFEADVDAPETLARVMADRDAGLQLGVQGTPTLFLNDQRIELTSGNQLRDDIEAALAG